MTIENIPIVPAEKTKDFPGLQFWCPFCKIWHRHGEGEGHRVAHCHRESSPFERTGYILKLRENLPRR